MELKKGIIYIPRKGKRGPVKFLGICLPVNIRLVLDEIAAIKGLSKKHIAEVTFDNACKLFRINK